MKSLMAMLANMFAFFSGFFGKVKTLGLALVAFAIAKGVPLHAVPIAAPDMTDATTSVTNVFGAVLGVAVLIFGFKKIKSLL